MMMNSFPVSRIWLLNDDESEDLEYSAEQFHSELETDAATTGVSAENQKLRFEFERDFREFIAFAESTGLGTPTPINCEVTYVNHVVAGDIWTNFSEIYKVVRGSSELDRMAFLPCTRRIVGAPQILRSGIAAGNFWGA